MMYNCVRGWVPKWITEISIGKCLPEPLLLTT